MKVNQKLIAVLLALCTALSLVMPAAAADMTASYGEASYYDIAVTNYSRMAAFQNGVVAAADREAHYGLIDVTGKVVVPFQYKELEALGGGLFRAAKEDGTEGLIDSTGKEALPFGNKSIQYSGTNKIIAVYDNSDGYSASYYTLELKPSTENMFWYGVDNSIPAFADYDYYWGDGGFYVAGKNETHYLFNSSYQQIFTSSEYIELANEGKLAIVGGKVYNTANMTETSYSGLYDSLEVSYNGFLKVESGSQKGAIDFDGNVLVPLGNYREIGNKSPEGYIAATNFEGDDYDPAGMTSASSDIYLNGQLVKTFPNKRIATEEYYRDLLFSVPGQGRGVMNLDGKEIIPAVYSEIWEGEDGYEVYTTSWKQGLYAFDGAQIFAPEYDYISKLDGSMYQLSRGGLYGISTSSGTEVFPMQYQNIAVYSNDFIVLRENDITKVVDINGKERIPATTQSMDVVTTNLIELSGNGRTTYINGSNQTLIPSSEEVGLFESNSKSYWATLGGCIYGASIYDGYTGSVLPFCYKKDDGSYATAYIDYNAGTSNGTLPLRASNINGDGVFVYQDASGKFGFGSTKGNLPSTTTPEASYIYDTVDPGESLELPAHVLEQVTDPSSAADAVTYLTNMMTNEQKTSATGIDLATLFAETAAAKAASKDVAGGDILINAALLADVTATADAALAAVSTALNGGGVSAEREISRTVILRTDATAFTARIDPDVLTANTDKVRVETPTFALTFKLTDLAPDLTKILTFTAEDTGVSAVTRSGDSAVVVIELPEDGVTNSVTVSMPSGSGDKTYQAVVAADGSATASKYNPATTKMDGKVNKSGTYSVRTNEKDFTDISSKSAEMQKAIRYLASKGIIGGRTATTFEPDGSITRAEIANLLVKALGKLDSKAVPSFSDVKSSDWFYSAAGSSQKHGLIGGEDGKFLGNKNIIKVQIVIVASRVLANEMHYKTPSNVSSLLSRYSDGVASWAQDEVSLAVRENLVLNRTDGTFAGDKNMTRGDAAIIIYRMFQKIW